MTEQTRKYPLGEVHTKMGAMGEVRFDQSLLDVLGIKLGDFVMFTISAEGVVTVTGEKKADLTKPVAAPQGVTGISSNEVTQPALFDAGLLTPQRTNQRRLSAKTPQL